jgi:hypothetical protein
LLIFFSKALIFLKVGNLIIGFQANTSKAE